MCYYLSFIGWSFVISEITCALVRYQPKPEADNAYRELPFIIKTSVNYKDFSYCETSYLHM